MTLKLREVQRLLGPAQRFSVDASQRCCYACVRVEWGKRFGERESLITVIISTVQICRRYMAFILEISLTFLLR